MDKDDFWGDVPHQYPREARADFHMPVNDHSQVVRGIPGPDGADEEDEI